MIDNRSENVRKICCDYIDHHCHRCPLRKPCQTKPGDTKEIFDVRMNLAAEELEK